MPTDLLELATRLACDAADLLREGLGRTRASVASKSSRTDMVTEMDRAAEDLIVSGLRTARPHDAILAEEGTADEGTSGVRWIVDPLDGTTNYLYGLPGFAVSIAAEQHGQVVAGVVVDPVRGDVYRARRGGGATRNDRELHMEGSRDLGLALIGTGFSYDPAMREHQAAVLTHVIGRVRDIRRFGAASMDLCMVATGTLDAYYERMLKPWDFAAGSLIASEAGACVGELGDGPLGSGCLVAAAPELYEPLRALLRAAEAASRR